MSLPFETGSAQEDCQQMVTDSPSPFPAFLPHPQDIFWPEMCGFKGKFVCEIDVVECGTKIGARFLIFVIEGYRK